jgi:poly(A) polymerase
MAPNDPRAIAWSIGTEGAVDRYLITGGQSALAAVALLNTWERPVFPLSGKDIIAHGIRPGPEVARLLQAVERQWVVEGFPPQARLDEMMRDAVGPSEL